MPTRSLARPLTGKSRLALSAHTFCGALSAQGIQCGSTVRMLLLHGAEASDLLRLTSGFSFYFVLPRLLLAGALGDVGCDAHVFLLFLVLKLRFACELRSVGCSSILQHSLACKSALLLPLQHLLPDFVGFFQHSLPLLVQHFSLSHFLRLVLLDLHLDNLGATQPLPVLLLLALLDEFDETVNRSF